MRKRLIIGMSGASGAPLTIELLKQLQQYKEIIETHLIVTKGAEMTLEQETDYTLEQLYALADEVHDNYNIGAGPASGSYRTMGMIVIPCSMKTLAGIVSGYSDNLVLRAADITLKEIIETHLIVTKGAEMTLEQETDYTLEQLYALADEVHDNYNIGAGPASGSYRTMGMIVIPCSMKTLAGIVSGYSDNLVLRAADITLKERRKKISLPENGLSRYGNLSNNRCLCWQEYIMIIWKRNS